MQYRAKEVVGAVCSQHSKTLLAAAALVGGIVVFKTAALASHPSPQENNINNYEKDILHLFIHHRWSHGPNFFPHCLKVEAFLRLAKIPYIVHFTSDASISPTGRLPCIIHKENKIGDSELIIQYLQEEYKVKMDKQLTPQDHAVGLVVRRMSETSLNYALQRTMFIDRPELMQDMFTKEYLLDPSLSHKVVQSMRSRLMKVLKIIGYGNISNEEYATEFLREVQSLEVLLANKLFLLGDNPTSYDCSVFGWLQVASEMGPQGPAISYLINSRIIREYITRMTHLAFPDIQEINTSSDSQRFVP